MLCLASVLGLLATAHSYTLSERPWMDKSLAPDKRAELLVKNMVCSPSPCYNVAFFSEAENGLVWMTQKRGNVSSMYLMYHFLLHIVLYV